MNNSKHDLTRRDALRVGAGTLLGRACGLEPSKLPTQASVETSRLLPSMIFNFHYLDDKAVPFLERAFALMKSGDSKPELCLVSGDFSEHECETGA